MSAVIVKPGSVPGSAVFRGQPFDAVELRHDDEGVPGVFVHLVAGGSDHVADCRTDGIARRTGATYARQHGVPVHDFLPD